MASPKLQHRFSYKLIFRSFLLIMLPVSITGCLSSLPKPVDNSSSLIILSVEAERNLGSNKPDVVVISRKNDGKRFEYTSRDGKYYFFANLPAGTYQIESAAILIKGGSTSSQNGNVKTTLSTSTASSFSFDKKIIKTSTIKLTAGKVAFMGSITAEGTSKLFPPGAIEISNVKISKSEADKNAALTYFKNEFKDSPWVTYIK